jgi:hypothetical protein
MHLKSRLLSVGLLIAAVGCAADNRPKYATPESPKSDLATLKGAWGTYIHEVDGKRVDTNIQLANWGWNSVDVTPGPHKLMVLVHTFNGNSYMSTYSENGGRFTFRCDKGHTYEFCRRNLFSMALKVTDKNTGQEMDLP